MLINILKAITSAGLYTKLGKSKYLHYSTNTLATVLILECTDRNKTIFFI